MCPGYNQIRAECKAVEEDKAVEDKSAGEDGVPAGAADVKEDPGEADVPAEDAGKNCSFLDQFI